MKTKLKSKPTLITLALAAAWLGALEGQAYAQCDTNIYSINIVGYVNLTLTIGYNFIANPLYAVDRWGAVDNSLTNIIKPDTVNGWPPDGTQVYVWDTTNQVFLPPATYSAALPGWDTSYDLPPGRGFVVYTTDTWINTFVGELWDNYYYTNFVAGSNKFSLLASQLPLAAVLSGPLFTNVSAADVLAFPGADGDNVYLFSSASQSYSDAFTCFDRFGWFDPDGAAGTNGPVINIGQSFFLQNPGADTNWVEYLNLDWCPTNSVVQSRVASQPEARAVIRGITAGAGNVALQIRNPGGGSYNVLFSADGVSWSTVAANQTGLVWTGRRPGGARGFYRLVKL